MLASFTYLAILLYFVFLILSMISDKEWKLGKNFISDLGVSKSRSARYLFNGGCVVFSAVFIISVLVFASEADLTISYYVVLALSIMMGIFLALVGIVNENIMPAHKWAAFSYFIVRFVLVAALILLDIYEAQYVLAIVTAIIVVSAIISAKRLEFPVTEVLWCFLLLGVIAVHFFMMV